jgi:hypothetical protein
MPVKVWLRIRKDAMVFNITYTRYQVIKDNFKSQHISFSGE